MEGTPAMPLPRTSRGLGVLAVACLTALPALPAVAAGAPAGPPTRAVELACPAERVQGTSFADATASVHGEAIRCLSWYGIAQGGADGSYGVGRAVTRAQLATFLTRVLDEAGIDLPESVEDAFTDDDGSTHEASLDLLAALGIMNGAGDGTVSPNEPVSRDQMASLLVRLLELVSDEELADAAEDFFSDDEGNVHEDAINALAGLGIAAGRGAGAFNPAADVLREQMATFLMRLVDRLVEDGDVRVPASLHLSAEEVSPGDVVDAVVLGDGIASVELVGCGFDGLVTDADPAAEGVQFSLVVPDAFPASSTDSSTDSSGGGTDRSTDTSTDGTDECEFLAVVTYDDGTTEELEGELELEEPEDTAGERDEAARPVERPAPATRA